MICIIKIKYVFCYNINKFKDNFFFKSLVEMKKSGHVIYVIKCFI
jgi:hypothetical protein